MKKYVMTYREFNEQLKNKVKNTSTENITGIKEEAGRDPNVISDEIATKEDFEEDEKEEQDDNINPAIQPV